MEFHQGKSNFLLIFNTKITTKKCESQQVANLVKRLTFQI